MIDRRPFETLGGADHGWLKAKHHFSFANYYDPARMGLGSLLVWNDDEIAPNSGFPPHQHNDMEIITYVREGAITHQDNLGNKGRTEAGDVQVMSAGSGIRHSEENFEPGRHADLSIWIQAEPSRRQAILGRQAVSERGTLRPFVTLASGFEADTEALSNQPVAPKRSIAERRNLFCRFPRRKRQCG